LLRLRIVVVFVCSPYSIIQRIRPIFSTLYWQSSFVCPAIYGDDIKYLLQINTNAWLLFLNRLWHSFANNLALTDMWRTCVV